MPRRMSLKRTRKKQKDNLHSNKPVEDASGYKVGKKMSGRNGKGKYRVGTVKKSSGGWFKRWFKI